MELIQYFAYLGLISNISNPNYQYLKLMSI
nr:MAG TPA: hypothetical protein [Bacteriophage sp.]